MARLRVRAQALHELLLALSPVAAILARDPTMSEHVETTPYDHLAAEGLVAIQHLVDRLDELARPITLVAPSPTLDDETGF